MKVNAGSFNQLLIRVKLYIAGAHYITLAI